MQLTPPQMAMSQSPEGKAPHHENTHVSKRMCVFQFSTLLDGLAGEMKSHQGGGAGAVDSQRRPSEVEDIGDSVRCDTHGEPRACPVVDDSGVHVGGVGLIVSVHQTCSKNAIKPSGQRHEAGITCRLLIFKDLI